MPSDQPDQSLRSPTPLFVVAVLSFVPVFGIFFGAAGATWGMVSSRRRAMRAAIISLAGALINIVGLILISFLSPGSKTDSANADRAIAQRDMLKIVVALDHYHDDKHVYPVSLPDLKQSRGIFHPLSLLDKSGGALQFKNYQYIVAPDGQSYDLFGTGPDDKTGTADDQRPVLPDSLKAHTGFRPPAARPAS
jgi:hypothetical protein